MGWWDDWRGRLGVGGGGNGRRRGPLREGLDPVLTQAWERLSAAAPYPPDTPLDDVELLALDLETTGLQPAKHELLSFGLVPVRKGEVRLAGALHLPVRPRGDVGDSATVHGLTDDRLAREPTVAEVLPQVLRALVTEDGRRRVLLAHFALVETSFLEDVGVDVLGTWLDLQVVDTLEVERRLLGAQHSEMRPGAVRLHTCRTRHHLPRYQAHSAVVDAVACGELFLAQSATLVHRRRRPLLLDDVLER
ncbi:exonuclease domain-containing protein [Ornithinimicrobium sp. W1665]|uniref:exonuclease domain-containing protein n=1 Tax=Ornithinimicrobium sp. W1665 TaxID=3416666 RepID=UPI003CE8F244